MRFSSDELMSFGAELFRFAGVCDENAWITARRLVEADLRGRTGHGLIRAAPYLARLRAGGIDPCAEPVVRHETPVSAQVDGGNGLGQVTMTAATELAIAKAAASGVGIVGTVGSNHAGAAGLYPAMAARQGLVAVYLAVANANGMPPWGGTSPLLGPNPLAVAIPTAAGPPFLLDIATTAASHGTIKVARQEGRPMPVGWVVDPDGRPITDPNRADDGYLVPIGGYKGTGLTIAIGLLAGVLNGAAFGREVVDHRADPVTPTNTGQLIVVFRADLFRPFSDVLADLTRQLESLRRSGGPVRLPGDEAARLEEENLRKGVELPAEVRAALNTEASLAGIPRRLGKDEQ
jgi:L-2-hydroxycarboxylate dehydrogenase (NAD+)